MSWPKETRAGERFQQRLHRLRVQIDLLPEAQRPHLIELADTIIRQHRHLQNKVSHNDDADGTRCGNR